MRVRIAVCLLAVVVTVFACIDDPSSSQPSRPGAQHVQKLNGRGKRTRTIDDVYADIAKAESTFGGFFFDSKHIPVVYLTNTSRLGAARAAGLDAFLGGRRISPGAFRVLHAAYGWGTLTRWYACASPLVLGLENAISTDIDEAHNRLRFGVASVSAKGDVQAILAQCGIPSQAVAVDVVKWGRTKVGLNSTVGDPVRPIRGGVAIAFSKAGSPCTLGIVGRTGEGLFFTTAAHCSHNEFGNDTTSYWQNTLNNGADFIGRELLNAGNLSHVDDPACAVGWICQYADVNMGRFQSANAQLGLIARAVNPSHSRWTPGDTGLDAANPGMFVTGVDTSGGAYGDTVCKAGRRSGTTCGPITEACVNTKFDPVAHKYVLCTHSAEMYSLGGESGAPIWNLSKSTDDSTVVLAGVLWGGPDAYTTWYSGYARFRDEIFGADTFTVVADSPLVIPLYVEMSGPNDIGLTDTYAWSVHAWGAARTYTYQWKRKNAGSSTWTSLGTSSSQSQAVDDTSTDFTMRVIVTSGGMVDTNDIVVDVSPITSLDISGPTWVHANQVCHWTVTPTGGSEPFSYEWDGGGDTDTFGVYVLEHFWVGVTVTAANGSQAYTSQEITVDEGGPGC